MRRLNFGVVLILTLVAATALLPGCKRKPPVTVQMTEEGGGSAALASVVHVADPKTSVQLIKGFYDVEQNSWRWTTGKFSVALRAPAGPAQKRREADTAILAPRSGAQDRQVLTISAKANGVDCARNFHQAGDWEYTKDVPASAFTNESVMVDFTLDKFLTAGSVDARELGVVVTERRPGTKMTRAGRAAYWLVASRCLSGALLVRRVGLVSAGRFCLAEPEAEGTRLA